MTQRNPVADLETALVWATPAQVRQIAEASIDLAKHYRETLVRLRELSEPAGWRRLGAMGAIREAKRLGADALDYTPASMRTSS